MMEPVAEYMTPRQKFGGKVRMQIERLRRRLPYLVWAGDEISVRVTFSENRLTASDPADAHAQLSTGALPEIEERFREIGVYFDKGLGMDGRDWEWDYSLQGPISVTFVSPTRGKLK